MGATASREVPCNTVRNLAESFVESRAPNIANTVEVRDMPSATRGEMLPV